MTVENLFIKKNLLSILSIIILFIIHFFSRLYFLPYIVDIPVRIIFTCILLILYLLIYLCAENKFIILGMRIYWGLSLIREVCNLAVIILFFINPADSKGGLLFMKISNLIYECFGWIFSANFIFYLPWDFQYKGLTLPGGDVLLITVSIIFFSLFCNKHSQI